MQLEKSNKTNNFPVSKGVTQTVIQDVIHEVKNEKNINFLNAKPAEIKLQAGY